MNLNNLPVAGTYNIVVVPQSGATGSFNIQLNSDVGGTLVANTALPVVLKSGQNARLTFTGAVGDSVGLEFAQVSTIPAGRTLYAYVYRPTDTVTLSGNSFGGYWQYVAIPNTGATLSLPVLPAAGSYKVVLDTTYQETANVRVTLEAGTVLTIDASATSATIANAGETARFTFTGALGQNLGLGVSNLALVPTSVTYGYVYVYKPDATLLLSQICYATAANGPGCQLNLNNLPVAGTYSIVVVPQSGATGSFNIQLNSDVGGTLVANTVLPVSLKSGQNARLSFSGAAGDAVALEFTQVATVPAGRTLGAYVYRPTDTTTLSGNNFNGHWQYVSVPNAGATLQLPMLPTAGTYKIVLDTTYQETASLNVTLRPANAITVDGASLNVATTTPGTSARVVFNATAGQNLGLGLTGLTHTPASGSASYIYVYRPDGVQFGGAIGCYTSNPGGSCQVNLSNLPQTGSYSLILVPPATSTLSATLTVSRDLTGTLANNTPQNVSIARQGQNARYTFSGTAGQLIGLEMTQLATVPARQVVYMTLLKPDGTTLVSTNSGSSDGAVLSATLPTTGTYTVFDPNFGATASLSAGAQSAG